MIRGKVRLCWKNLNMKIWKEGTKGNSWCTANDHKKLKRELKPLERSGQDSQHSWSQSSEITNKRDQMIGFSPLQLHSWKTKTKLNLEAIKRTDSPLHMGSKPCKYHYFYEVYYPKPSAWSHADSHCLQSQSARTCSAWNFSTEMFKSVCYLLFHENCISGSCVYSVPSNTKKQKTSLKRSVLLNILP